MTAKGTVPVEFDWGPAQGDPDFYAAPEPGNLASGTFTPVGGVLQPGTWVASPDQIGPYPSPSPLASVRMTMTVQARAFDSAMTPSTGDLWRAAVNIAVPFDPLEIAVGQSRVITLTLRPNGAPGTVVRGDLYVDDFQATGAAERRDDRRRAGRDPLHVQDQVAGSPLPQQARRCTAPAEVRSLIQTRHR